MSVSGEPIPSDPPPSATAVPRRQLSLFDSTSIIVGIIIGSGIYEASPLIASAAPGPVGLLGLWLLGGLFALVGSLCYAELGTTFPVEGGDYAYLSRAFGRPVGFLFAWAELWVVRPGSIGAMAFVFGNYASQLHWLGGQSALVYAVASVATLSTINLAGITTGKWTQNVLTSAKILGLLAVVGAGLWHSSPAAAPAPAPSGEADWGFAMILILYAYGGWNEMAYVGAEVRNPKRNILRALMLGTCTVTLIYVLLTAAFLHALGIDGMRRSGAVAADVVQLVGGRWGAAAISVLVCISALGAINGMILTGARIYYALGTEHRLFSLLGRWSPRGTPVWSLVVQSLVTLGVVLAFGGRPPAQAPESEQPAAEQSQQDTAQAAADESGPSGFERMVCFTLPVFWFFLLLVGLSLFWLRRTQPDAPRPFRVPLYPLTPCLFCASSAYMLYASLAYAYQEHSSEALWSIGLMAAGLIVCWLDRRAGNHHA